VSVLVRALAWIRPRSPSACYRLCGMLISARVGLMICKSLSLRGFAAPVDLVTRTKRPPRDEHARTWQLAI